ncbi:MAG TPA: PAS domain S-box protein, partial [Methanothrix soehngenii]|nr:PAS domain S-box protein [Methanothrix soehngenii]
MATLDRDKVSTAGDNCDQQTDPEIDKDFAHQVMATVGQGIVVSSEGWRFEYVNPAFARMVGRMPKELIGRSMDELIHPHDLPILIQARSRRQAGETSSYEARLIRSDGCVFPVQVTGTPRWQDGKFFGSIVAVTDLTERKRFEDELKKSEA